MLQALPVSSSIVEYVIAQEDHQDGTKHLHAFLKYEKKVQFSATKWDIADFHGNYQQARSWVAVERYCKKGGNYISNICLESAAQKKGKKNLQILTEDLRDLVADGVIHALQLPQAVKARAIYSLLGDPYQHHDIRGVWIYGPPGVGKSRHVRDRHPDCFIKSQSKWWDGYQGQEVVLLDDFDRLGVCLSHYLKIWADRYAAIGEVKGGSIPLMHKTFYVTSNYHPRDLWSQEDDQDLLDAILRRFKIHHMLPQDLCLGKRAPIINSLPQTP